MGEYLVRVGGRVRQLGKRQPRASSVELEAGWREGEGCRLRAGGEGEQGSDSGPLGGGGSRAAAPHGD